MPASKVSRTKYLYPKTVKGNPYLYFRMANGSLVPLPLDKDSAEFCRCYDDCLKERGGTVAPVAQQPVAKQDVPIIVKNVAFIGGTFGKAVEVYKRSPEWLELRDSTRAQYISQLDVMLENLATVALCEFDLDAVDTYSAEMAIPRWVKRNVRGTLKKVRRGGPVAADTHVALLSNVWQVCRKYPEFGIKNIPNPTRDAEKRSLKSKNPARPWSDEQQDIFLRGAPEHLALGYLMLKYFGQRGGDSVQVAWQQFARLEIDGRKVYGIWVAPEKGDDAEPEFCEVPKRLADAILLAQKTRGDAPTILTTVWGTPWSSANALSAAIRNHLIKVGLAKRGTKTISMHGLRKNAAILAADTDLGTAGIKSMTLHKSNAMAEYYAARRNRMKVRSNVIGKINEMEDEKATAKVRAKRANIRRVK
jgi:integrase